MLHLLQPGCRKVTVGGWRQPIDLQISEQERLVHGHRPWHQANYQQNQGEQGQDVCWRFQSVSNRQQGSTMNPLAFFSQKICSITFDQSSNLYMTGCTAWSVKVCSTPSALHGLTVPSSTWTSTRNYMNILHCGSTPRPRSWAICLAPRGRWATRRLASSSVMLLKHYHWDPFYVFICRRLSFQQDCFWQNRMSLDQMCL